jgi:hypothetical protein
MYWPGTSWEGLPSTPEAATARAVTTRRMDAIRTEVAGPDGWRAGLEREAGERTRSLAAARSRDHSSVTGRGKCVVPVRREGFTQISIPAFPRDLFFARPSSRPPARGDTCGLIYRVCSTCRPSKAQKRNIGLNGACRVRRHSEFTQQGQMSYHRQELIDPIGPRPVPAQGRPRALFGAWLGRCRSGAMS